MPQLDLVRIFIDNITWILGFTFIILGFITITSIAPYIETFQLKKLKKNLKTSLKLNLFNKV